MFLVLFNKRTKLFDVSFEFDDDGRFECFVLARDYKYSFLQRAGGFLF
jgi:hypothetical protein